MMFIPTSRILGLLNGAVLVSLLRTVIHFGNNLPVLAISFIMGLLGCYLYIKIKRILVPLLLHSSFNFFVLMQELSSFSVL
jgi:membrane protease YdiL (CAAX protease family)